MRDFRDFSGTSWPVFRRRFLCSVDGPLPDRACRALHLDSRCRRLRSTANWVRPDCDRGQRMVHVAGEAELMRIRFKNWVSTITGFTVVAAFASTAAGQTPPAAPPDPNPGGFTLTGSFDAVSTYMFRGIRQHSTGMALWPVADLGVARLLRGRRAQERGGQRGTVEQPAHRRHRHRWTKRQAVVRVGLLHDAEPRVRRRHQPRHDLYRAIPVRTTRLRASRRLRSSSASTIARISASGHSSRTRSSRSSSTPRSASDRPTAARRPAAISSSASRQATPVRAHRSPCR